MATVRPSTNVLSGGKIGLTGTDVYIQAERIDERLYTQVADVTGDGDSNPVFVTNALLYGTLSITGWMIGGQSTGIANTIRAGTSLSITVTYSTNRTITGTLIIQQCRKSWRRSSQTVPLAIAGTFTGSITEA